MIPTMIMYMLLKCAVVTIFGMLFVPPRLIQQFIKGIGRKFRIY